LGDNSYFKEQADIVEGNENFSRRQRWKSLSLISTQAARFTQYTLPIFFKNGLIDALKFETGLLPDKEWKQFRGYIGSKAKESVPYNVRKFFNLTKKNRVLHPSFVKQGINKNMQGHRSIMEIQALQSDLDFIRGKATPSEVLSKKRKRRKGVRSGSIMESLSFMEAMGK
jgi:hypothetical protein